MIFRVFLSFYIIYDIFRKWNRLCVSYDFMKNEAQLAFSGHVSQLIKDPDTRNDDNRNGGNDIF